MVDEIRNAIRQLYREPRFAGAVVGILALAAAANLAVFAVVNGALLEPLPYRDPAQLVRIYETNRSLGIFRSAVSRGNFADWQRLATSFEAIEAYDPRPRDALVRIDDEPEIVRTASGTKGFVDMLGVAPLLGDLHTGDRLSHAFWRRRFGGDPGVVGRAIWFEGMRQISFTIGAVMPRGFDLPAGTDMWGTMSFGKERAARNATVLARIKPGVTPAQAQDEMNSIARALAREFPAENSGWEVEIEPLQESLVASVRPSLLLLYVSVSLLLLIATANVAVVCLARRIRRTRDVAVRIALGATTARLLRQALTECALLATLGAAIGLGIAALLIRVLVSAAPAAVPRLAEIAITGHIAAMAGVLAVLMTIVMLAVVSARTTLSLAALRGGPAEPARGGGHRVRSVLVITEIAACACLLVAVSASMRTFIALQQRPLGFEPSGIVMVDVRQPIFKAGEVVKHYPTGRFLATADAVVAFASTIPGVTGAALATSAPLDRAAGTATYRPVDHEIAGPLTGAPPLTGQVHTAVYRRVQGDYFRVMGMQVIAGRAFGEHDRLDDRQIDDFDADRGAGVAIVSQSVARSVWPDGRAVGRFMQIDEASYRSVQVVGVVNDIVSAPGEPASPTIYLPYGDDPGDRFTLLVRGRTAADVAAALSPLWHRLGSDVTAFNRRTYDDVASAALARPRFTSRVMSGFGGIALVLSAVALYTVLSFVVLLRRREIAIRIAIGAEPRTLARRVVRSGIALSAAGLLAGVPFSFALLKVVQGSLGDMQSAGAADVAAVAAALALTGAAASWIPARRAARVDPIQLLRAE